MLKEVMMLPRKKAIEDYLSEFFNGKFTVYHVKTLGLIFVLSILLGMGFRLGSLLVQSIIN